MAAPPEWPVHWVDGVCNADLSCHDRGFTYGDGLFETLRYQAGRYQLLEAHLQRMVLGCKVLGLPWPGQKIEEQLVIASEHLAVAGIERACLRLTLSRGSGGRGYTPPEPCNPVLVCSLHELALAWGETPAPVVATLCETRLASQPLLAGIKHANRLDQVLAAREVAEAGAEEGIQCNQGGALISALSGNLFAWNGESWMTPPITDCGVRGTVRNFLLETVGPRHNIPMREDELKPDSLDSFQSLCSSNSLLGLREITALGTHRFKDSAAVSRLRLAFQSEMDTLQL